jgi:hypothetical protein
MHKEKGFNLAMVFSGLSAMGFILLIINLIIIVDKFISWQRFYALKGNLYLNDLLGIFVIICSFLSIKANRKSTRKMQKIIGITYSIISILTVIILFFWGTFNFIR